jgi:predicted nucleotidyltransferase
MKKPTDEKSITGYFAQMVKGMPVSIAYLYGSFLDETFHQNSDIDIALVLKKPPEKLVLFQMEMKIADLLDQKFKIPFDVRTINDAPLKVKGEIITHGKLIFCADEEFRIDFETYVRSRYFDYLPALQSMREVFLDSVKSGGLIGKT